MSKYNSEYIGRKGQSRIYKIKKEGQELYFAVRNIILKNLNLKIYKFDFYFL
jgi:hypothetical protein